MSHRFRKSKLAIARIPEQLAYVTDNERDAEALAMLEGAIVVRRTEDERSMSRRRSQKLQTSGSPRHPADSDASQFQV